MVKEIRKETSLLGEEKEVIYENNKKIGEIRKESTITGDSVQREYNSAGQRVREIRHEQTVLNEPVDRIYDSKTGGHLGEVRHERNILDEPVDRTYDKDGAVVCETHREPTFLGRIVKRVYDKRLPDLPHSAADQDSSYTDSSSVRSERDSAARFASLFLVAVLFASGILVLVWIGGHHSPAPIIDSFPSLEHAKRSIPAKVTRIYSALNEGNPRAARGLISGGLLSDYRKLDYICKPFTYRSHYIEAIMERPGGHFYVRVHVLLEPMDEHAYILDFRVFRGQLLLDDVIEPSKDWFGAEEDVAAELARNFVYAARAGRQEVLRRLVSPRIPTASFTTEPCWRQFFSDIDKPIRLVSVEMSSYKGLKAKVELDLRPEAGFGFQALGRAYFLVDRVGREYRIVSADPHGTYHNFWHPSELCQDESVLGKIDDPAMESMTLKRFHLSQ